jgi:hypothetical protein
MEAKSRSLKTGDTYDAIVAWLTLLYFTDRSSAIRKLFAYCGLGAGDRAIARMATFSAMLHVIERKAA